MYQLSELISQQHKKCSDCRRNYPIKKYLDMHMEKIIKIKWYRKRAKPIKSIKKNAKLNKTQFEIECRYGRHSTAKKCKTI